MVRTLAFHVSDTGSNPVGVIHKNPLFGAGFCVSDVSNLMTRERPVEEFLHGPCKPQWQFELETVVREADACAAWREVQIANKVLTAL